MRIILLLLSLITSMIVYSAVQITDVKATPISPWAVKIDYRVIGGCGNNLFLFASNAITHQVCCANPNAIKGDFKLTDGRHSIRWNLTGDNVKWDWCNVTFEISEATYCVIDLSAGVNATSYPVIYLSDIPSGGWKAEHKTTKLVLRLIEPGSFKMNGSYDVTLTKHYYISVFEVTQKQYQLVTGQKPSQFSNDKLPVERVSWNMIRGYSGTHNWPTKRTVDSNSFIGRLRARTGLEFDLPTEAQWEYACRAGSKTTYSYGNSVNGDYMWYDGNSSSKTHEVGTKLHNAWGLYDMHGNVLEWCLDWSGDLSSGTDPKGAVSGSNRIKRGGCYLRGNNGECTSSHRRLANPPEHVYCDTGFRLVRNMSK